MRLACSLISHLDHQLWNSLRVSNIVMELAFAISGESSVKSHWYQCIVFKLILLNSVRFLDDNVM